MQWYVVTGGGRGIGRAIVERLLKDGQGVVAIDLHPTVLSWTDGHSARERLQGVAGNAADEAIAEHAADVAESRGKLAGWINNAAVFRDAAIHSAPPGDIAELVGLNLAPVIVGCSVAIRRFLRSKTPGTVVNVSSHQARRAVRGCPAYVTAKAAIEGLTRALAVDYGACGIRINAVALGSIRTERYEALLQEQERAASIEGQMRALHPLARVGEPCEVAAAVAYLLSDESSFITGATLPVDGGRSVIGFDPEARASDIRHAEARSW